MAAAGLCCFRVEVEASPLQKFRIPFLILDPKSFLRRKKERSFIGDWGIHGLGSGWEEIMGG